MDAVRHDTETRRLTIRRLLAFFLWGLFIVALGEMAFRLVVFPDYRSLLQDIYQPHPLIGHYNKPNLAVRRFNPMNYDVINHTNSLGFRGREEDLEGEIAGVWVAGSSNTFGGSVKDGEVFAARLAAHRYQAANLASEGHNMPDQALVLRYLAAQGYRPRAVVLALPIFHAIQDYDHRRTALTRPLGALAPVQETASGPATAHHRLLTAAAGLWEAVPGSFMSLRARLIRNSAIYGWLKVGIMGVPVLRELTLRLGLRADLDLVYKQSLDLLLPQAPDNPTRWLIRSTAEYARAIGVMVRDTFAVPFGIVLLPAPHHIYPERFERYVRHFGLENQDLDPVRPLAALAERLKTLGVPVLNTLPALRAANDRPLVFPDDGHLNATAHAIVASRIATWLAQDLRVLPTP